MYRKLFIFIIIFQFIFLISCKKNVVYQNKETGFSFIIPKGCIIGTEDKGDNYYIRIYIRNPEKLLDGVEQFNKIKNDIENNIYPHIPNIPSSFIKFQKIGNTKIGIDFNTGYDPYDGIIGKRIFFIKNNRFITIYLNYEYEGPKDENDKNNLKIIFNEIEEKYYKKAKSEGIVDNNIGSYIINEIDKYIHENKDKKTEIPDEVVKLFMLFDELVSSLKFY